MKNNIYVCKVISAPLLGVIITVPWFPSKFRSKTWRSNDRSQNADCLVDAERERTFRTTNPTASNWVQEPSNSINSPLFVCSFLATVQYKAIARTCWLHAHLLQQWVNYDRKLLTSFLPMFSWKLHSQSNFISINLNYQNRILHAILKIKDNIEY